MDGTLAVLTMQSRPHNFLGSDLIDGVLAAVEWAVAEDARAIVLRSGLRNFCAGADLGLFSSADRGEAPDVDLVEVLRMFDELPVPVVASVHGVCVGGGFELALACDLIVAAQSAKIGCVEATIGMNPLMGAVQRITERAGSARAKEMALLARRYDPATLERWNIINRVVSDDSLEAVSLALGQELAHGPTVAHASTKALVSYAAGHGPRATDARMAELQKDIWTSNDLQVGLQSLAQNGPGAARFEGR
ncbi:enoyl-CoA hydratase/isomerase family protein [Actinomycetospora corticicola]|nr:enoyl-CoA hydratase/isomerase family protein [Actinomycetospora corticicola]